MSDPLQKASKYDVLTCEVRNAYAAAIGTDLRYGQIAFNVLHKNYPEIAEKVRATEIDPFHFDLTSPVVIAFWTFVYQELLNERS